MHVSSRILFVPLMLAASACSAAAPEEPEQSASTSEALVTNNQSVDFELGVVVVNYDDAGNPTKSRETWTNWASRISNEMWTDWVGVPYVDAPTGIRVDLFPTLDRYTGTLYQYLDFRVGIQTSKRGIPSPEQWTLWASEIEGGPNNTAWAKWSDDAVLPSGETAVAYRVGVSTRLWTNTHRRLLNFRVGARALFPDPCFGNALTWGETQWTPWALSGGGMGHTAAAGGCRTSIQVGMAIALNTSYENI